MIKKKSFLMSFTLICVLAVSIIFFTACGKKDESKRAAEDQVIKIGAILPQTGKSAVIGEFERKGLLLALEHFQKQNPNIKIDLLLTDFESDPKKAATLANDLVLKKVDAVIASTTQACEIISPILESKKIILFALSPDMDIVKRSKYNYRIFFNLKTELDVVKKFIIDNNLSEISIFSFNYSSIQKSVNLLIDFLKEKNIKITLDEKFDANLIDYKDVWSKFSFSKSMNLYLKPFPNQIQNLVKQMKEAQIDLNKKTIIGDFAFQWQPISFLENLEGMYFICPQYQISAGENNEITANFIKKYQSQPNFDAMYAYDNFKILVDLLTKSQKQLDKFESLFNSYGEYLGASGKIEFIGSRDTNVEVSIAKMSNGRFVNQ